MDGLACHDRELGFFFSSRWEVSDGEALNKFKPMG